jgi:NAD(P)H-nitrite reductase large subunit
VTDDAIVVNAQLETSVKGIYAAGDCTGDRQLYVFLTQPFVLSRKLNSTSHPRF